MHTALAARVVLEVSSWNRAQLADYLKHHGYQDTPYAELRAWSHAELVAAVLDIKRGLS